MSSEKSGPSWEDVLNALSGALDPEIFEAAKKIAQRLPAESGLRTKSGIRIFGIVKQAAELMIERSKLGTGPKILGERVVDLGDAVSYAATHEVPGTLPATDDWLAPWFAEAAERLRSATTAQAKKAEGKQLAVELVILKGLQRQATPRSARKGSRKTGTENRPSILQQINKGLRAALAAQGVDLPKKEEE